MTEPIRSFWPPRPPLILLAAVIALALALILRSAWVCDDALISFRVLDHFVNGDGLRFNVAERVQAYTHPLWLLLLSPVYFVAREAFFTPIFLSLVSVAAALGFFAALCYRAKGVAVAAILCMLSSKAFVDYATSGLETALGYLLVAAWLYAYTKTPAPEASAGRRLGISVLLASLLFVNRMDSVLLVAPAILYQGAALARSEAPRAWLRPLLLGLSPALAWLAFSTLYYGTPVPNTAWAKLGTGIERSALHAQGLFYLGQALRSDPVTPLLIAMAILGTPLYAFVRRDWRLVPVAGGLLLSLLYVVEVGGDFMMGRFLALPFFLSVMVLTLLDAPTWKRWRRLGTAATVAVCLGLSLLSPLSPWRAHSGYENTDEARVVADRGIADERGFYYQRYGLLAPESESRLVAGSACSEEGPTVVIRSVCGDLGYQGFTGCSERLLADRCALSDAFLARMPMIDPQRWRVGHYFRRVPAGYRESLEQDANRIVTPAIAALYEDVRLATRAPLFAAGRWGAIWRLHTKDYRVRP